MQYDSYKDSGEQWLGQIPSHWEMKRWRFLLAENSEQNNKCRVKTQLQFKYGDIVPKANQEIDEDVLKTISKYTVVQPNDIMINGLNLNYDFISQRIAQVREVGVITSAYISLRPLAGIVPQYYNYFLKAMDSMKMFHGMGTGVRLTLSYKELRNRLLPLPPQSEQERMVAYLDEQTAKIDAAIAQQQKMIDLLNERKQIIIQNAVTKGLDPNAKMKDSGIDWIGEIPEGWKIMRVKHFFNVSRGRVISREELVDGGEYPVYSSQTENDGCLGYLSTYDYEDEILTWTTDGAKAGSVFHRQGRFNCTNVCGILQQRKDIAKFEIRYIYYALGRSAFYNRRADILGFKIMSNEMAEIKFTFPKAEEQLLIADYLDKNLEVFVSAISKAETLINLLQERKQIIINEVVTGKIKIV